MSESSFDFFLICFSIVLTIVGSFTASYLQERNQQFQIKTSKITKKSEIALATVQNVSKLLDHRLYRQKRLLWAINSKEESRIESSLLQYQESLFLWMDSLGTLKSEIWSSFDWHTMSDFENNIHLALSKAGTEIELLLKKSNPTSALEQQTQLDYIGYYGYRFTNDLLQRISAGDIRGLKNMNIISFDNAENLSNSFLIKRLFGYPVKENTII